MNSHIPDVKSIPELAAFWDQHDVTEFDAELEEVTSPVFSGDGQVTIQLDESDRAALRACAQKSGLDEDHLVRMWIIERLRSA